MSGEVDVILARIDRLSQPELLALHREVCRRAAKVYGVLYQPVRDANYRTAMALRDTRFQPGLTVQENITRCARRPRPAGHRTP